MEEEDGQVNNLVPPTDGSESTLGKEQGVVKGGIIARNEAKTFPNYKSVMFFSDSGANFKDGEKVQFIVEEAEVYAKPITGTSSPVKLTMPVAFDVKPK